MRIKFIHHSAFWVETPSAQLLFDYYTGELPSPDPQRPLYVLASHSHGDHYGRVIYSLPEKHPDVRYILSSDIPERDIPRGFASPVRRIAPHEAYRDEILKLTTLRSNDRGVAYVCELDELKLYHGGDLNNWCWDQGETALEDERIYHEELDRIRDTEFDAAFIPMDTRLEAFHRGIEDFWQHARARAIFPMHVWGKFGKIEELCSLPSSVGYRDRIVQIREDGQEFTL